MSVSNIDEQIACIEREIKQRARVYPRLIAQGKMTTELAERESKRMGDVLATLLIVQRICVRNNYSPCENLDCASFAEKLEAVAPLPPQGSLL